MIQGASEEDINIFGKIVAVADVFDAMTTNRVYKQRVSPFNAFEMFLTVGLGLFDTTIIQEFIKNIPHYYIGSRVLLSNNKIGEIVYIPPHDIICPLIEIDSNIYDLSSNKKIKILRVV